MATQNRYRQFYSIGGKYVDTTGWNKDMNLNYLTSNFGWEGAMAYGNLIHDDMNAHGPGIEEGDIYVDLGSNIGMSALVAERQKASKIYCIEPDYDCYEALARNRGQNWVLDNVAVSHEPGIIHVAKWPDWTDLRPVNAITFDQFMAQHCIEKIDYLKIDIEGHEKTVIPSISDATWSKIRKIFIEYHETTTLPESERNAERFNFLQLLSSKGFSNHFLLTGYHQSFIYMWK